MRNRTRFRFLLYDPNLFYRIFARLRPDIAIIEVTDSSATVGV